MKRAVDSSNRALPQTRWKILEESLDDLVQKAAELCVREGEQRVAPLLKVFAYGFGFGNPLDFIGGRPVEVRDLLDFGDGAATAVAIDKLADAWPTYRGHFEELYKKMGGATPMGSGFRCVAERLDNELRLSAHHGLPTIFVLSDGDPTDVQPQEILDMARTLKEKARIVSCFVTDSDLTEPMRLYGEQHPDWPAGADLMYHCASPVPLDQQFRGDLREDGWTVDPDARLFAQVNQSEMLSKFMNTLLNPLRRGKGKVSTPDEPGLSAPSDPGIVNVFVSYSHRDTDYMRELLDFLNGMSRDGFKFWSDEQIETGREWEKEISDHISQADIALVLVTQEFLDSQYIEDVEMRRFLQRRKRDGMIIYPIIVSPCNWEGVPWLAATQFQPRDGRTVAHTAEHPVQRRELHVSIRKELKDIGLRLNKKANSGE
jgi:hypothetical protein